MCGALRGDLATHFATPSSVIPSFLCAASGQEGMEEACHGVDHTAGVQTDRLATVAAV